MNKKPIISLIVAAEKNNLIGKNNELLWHLPDDLRFFKETTSGHCILMGRKTFESLRLKALPKRKNIVISRQGDYFEHHQDAIHVPQSSSLEFFTSLAEALQHCQEETEIFIMGGGEIYRESLPLADRVYLTAVEADLDGDTYFPELVPSEWKLVKSQFHPQDEKHPYAFTFQTFERVALIPD